MPLSKRIGIILTPPLPHSRASSPTRSLSPTWEGSAYGRHHSRTYGHHHSRFYGHHHSCTYGRHHSCTYGRHHSCTYGRHHSRTYGRHYSRTYSGRACGNSVMAGLTRARVLYARVTVWCLHHLHHIKVIVRDFYVVASCEKISASCEKNSASCEKILAFCEKNGLPIVLGGLRVIKKWCKWCKHQTVTRAY
jgi:hypothetical protein